MLTFNNKSLCLAAIVVMAISCGQKKDPHKKYFEKASEYNQYINEQFEEVNRLWNATLTRMDDSLLVYSTLDSLKIASKDAAQNMDKLVGFKDDTIYKGAAKNYFNYMNREANTRLQEAVGIGIMQDVSDSLFFRFEEIGRLIGKEKEIFILHLKRAQQQFIIVTAK